jgi:hypothetical protein
MYWQPGWGESTTDEFQSKVREAMEASPKGWVFDGNYERRLGSDLLQKNATDIICKDDFSLETFIHLQV